MALHPDAEAFFAAREAAGALPVEDMTVPDARAQSIRLAAGLARQDVARVRDMEIPGAHGEIGLRLYYPSKANPLPVVVFFHGGGWVLGNLETADAVCREWANGSQCLVVSVNYHHAPEYKFPAAADDAYTATSWVSEHAADIGADPARLAVAGMSAGGGLAATSALMARERGAPQIAFQLLWVPVLNYSFETRSYHDNAEGYGLTRAGMRYFWGHYLQRPEDGANPYASPLRAHDFAKLPPALVLGAEFDPLLDEGRAYADKLRAAGVAVEYHCYQGMVHGFLGAQATRDAVMALRRALGVE